MEYQDLKLENTKLKQQLEYLWTFFESHAHRLYIENCEICNFFYDIKGGCFDEFDTFNPDYVCKECYDKYNYVCLTCQKYNEDNICKLCGKIL